jgi:hypothetical protein
MALQPCGGQLAAGLLGDVDEGWLLDCGASAVAGAAGLLPHGGIWPLICWLCGGCWLAGAGDGLTEGPPRTPLLWGGPFQPGVPLVANCVSQAAMRVACGGVPH